ncbi:MAG TPA: alpha/beta hydrolase [Thermoleophilaceae bacterium]|nr:alpha/beta hydrolase [Thermoleophilaceae bacterium]
MLEAGLRNRGDVWSTLAALGQTRTVLGVVARTTRVCAYDRPGTVSADLTAHSRSDPVRMPRSTFALAADLRALLRRARIRPPYVLVAHSTGGLVVRQYTSAHPRRVAGLVLVDAIPETMETSLPISTWNAYNAGYLTTPPAQLTDYADLEYVDFRQSFAQMRRAGVRPPRRIPYVVLSKGQTFGIPGRLGAWSTPPGYAASATSRRFDPTRRGSWPATAATTSSSRTPSSSSTMTSLWLGPDVQHRVVAERPADVEEEVVEVDEEVRPAGALNVVEGRDRGGDERTRAHRPAGAPHHDAEPVVLAEAVEQLGARDFPAVERDPERRAPQLFRRMHQAAARAAINSGTVTKR